MSELLEAGLAVTVTGMGTVFVLLSVLVVVVQGMSRLCAALGALAPAAPAAGDADAVEAEIVGVIAASVDRYRRGRRH